MNSNLVIFDILALDFCTCGPTLGSLSWEASRCQVKKLVFVVIGVEPK
jgi:hypothetical protein